MGRELIRGRAPHAWLTECIAKKMGDRVVRVTGQQWCDWYARNYAVMSVHPSASAFFRLMIHRFLPFAGDRLRHG